MSYTNQRISIDNFKDLAPIYKSAYSLNVMDPNIENKFDTQFAGNRYVGFFSYSEKNEPAGYYGVFPTDLHIGGKVIKSAQSGNTMVHKEHQGKGLFVTLAKATYELCEDIGIKIVFGFPSASSYPGFVKKLSWQHHENINKYNILVPTIPLSEFVQRVPFFKGIFSLWISFILNFYKKGNFFEGSIQAEKQDGVFRNQAYWDYKLKNDNIKILQFSNTNVVVKFEGKLGIGDIDFENTRDFKQIISSIKRFCFFAGINRISFYTSPNTRIDTELAKHYTANEGLPVAYVCFDEKIDAKNIKFSYFDFDTF